MTDFTNNVVWWLSMDALTIVMMIAITFAVVRLSHQDRPAVTWWTPRNSF
jgi:hypothetical protein